MSKQFCPQKQFIPSKRAERRSAKFILQRKRLFLLEKNMFFEEVDNFDESFRRFAEASVGLSTQKSLFIWIVPDKLINNITVPPAMRPVDNKKLTKQAVQ
jgi:hypothetical protein